LLLAPAGLGPLLEQHRRLHLRLPWVGRREGRQALDLPRQSDLRYPEEAGNRLLLPEKLRLPLELHQLVRPRHYPHRLQDPHMDLLSA
jgi:hypothetical protein